MLARINQLTESCRRAGILVIHTAHVLRPDGSNMGVLGEMVPKVRAGMLNRGAESAALHPLLNIDARDLLVEKPRFGAFHSTDLELILRSHGIDTVIISGIPPRSAVTRLLAKLMHETFGSSFSATPRRVAAQIPPRPRGFTTQR